MSNIAGALYRVTKIANEMKCSRRMKSVSVQCQFKQPCLQAAPEGKKWRRVPNSWREAVPGACSCCHGKCAVAERRASGRPDHQSRRVSKPETGDRTMLFMYTVSSKKRSHSLDSFFEDTVWINSICGTLSARTEEILLNLEDLFPSPLRTQLQLYFQTKHV